MSRWLLAVTGVAIGLAALWALVPFLSQEEAPLDDIDAASRAELERVLRQSSSADPGPDPAAGRR